MEMRQYTVTTDAQSETADLSAIFETIYYCKAWVTTTGVDAEVFVADEDYAADDLTFNHSGGDFYLVVIGKPVSSKGGAT